MKEQEMDFEALRKLLSLKQHEVPPPGFFDDFSGQVVSRIRRGDTEGSDALGSRIFTEAPWLLRFIRTMQAKPAYASAFVCALLLLLVIGIGYTDNPGTTPESFMPTQVSEVSSPIAAVAPSFLDESASQPGLVSSTNPVLNLEASAPAFVPSNPLYRPVAFPQ